MSKNKSNIDEVARVAHMYMDNPDILKKHVRERNEMAEKLNERVMNIIKVSPMFFKRNGDQLEQDFDVTTKEILKQIKLENENLLKKAFPDLYIISDTINEDEN